MVDYGQSDNPDVLKADIHDLLDQLELERSRHLQTYLPVLNVAYSWEEAFRKGKIRHQQQAAEEDAMPPEWFEQHSPEDAHFFGIQLEQIKFAEVVYLEEMRAIEDEIDALKQKARDKAADRVDAKFVEKTSVGQSLRQDSYDDLVEW